MNVQMKELWLKVRDMLSLKVHFFSDHPGVCFHNGLSRDTVKFIGKLENGTVFVKKGHGEEEPFEFRTDDGMQ